MFNPEFSWDFIIRSINGTGCLIALWYLSTAARRQWRDWNDKTQGHWWALVGWVFLGFEGALESIILDTKPGPRTIIQTLVVAWTLRALTIRDTLNAEPALGKKEDSDDA